MRLKDVFEHAYYGTNCALIYLAEFVMSLFEVLCVCVIYLTIPIWFIPYGIIKRKDDKNERQYVTARL